MAAAIPNDKRTRLVRLLGMLGSDFNGERANAGRLADTLVRSLGLRWDDVIAVAGASEQQRAVSPRTRQGRARGHRDAATACLASGCIWTEWERGFPHQHPATLEADREAESRPAAPLLSGQR
jgi:hypothetical protein